MNLDLLLEMEMASTAVVTLTDRAYISRAERTIKDVRTRGNWNGPIVLITVDFVPSIDLINKYDLIIYPVKHIDVSKLKEAWATHPIRRMADERHTKKLAQWNKLHVFDHYFANWERIIFLDAGLRVLDTLEPLLDLDWRGKILAPDDSSPGDNGNRFRLQLDYEANPPVTAAVYEKFGTDIIDRHYFLNCMWVYDTRLLATCNSRDLEEGMNLYPISLCNEMGIMNLYFAFLHNVWTPFPEKTAAGKYLFGWCEYNFPIQNWTNFHFLKYPVTIGFDKD